MDQKQHEPTWEDFQSVQIAFYASHHDLSNANGVKSRAIDYALKAAKTFMEEGKIQNFGEANFFVGAYFNKFVEKPEEYNINSDNLSSIVLRDVEQRYRKIIAPFEEKFGIGYRPPQASPLAFRAPQAVQQRPIGPQQGMGNPQR